MKCSDEGVEAPSDAHETLERQYGFGLIGRFHREKLALVVGSDLSIVEDLVARFPSRLNRPRLLRPTLRGLCEIARCLRVRTLPVAKSASLRALQTSVQRGYHAVPFSLTVRRLPVTAASQIGTFVDSCLTPRSLRRSPMQSPRHPVAPLADPVFRLACHPGCLRLRGVGSQLGDTRRAFAPPEPIAGSSSNPRCSQ